MTEPLVSVNMITYNHAPYIAQAIEGVMMQATNFPFELVIGEDCSTDNTLEIASRYRKKFPERIRLISSDKNVGARANNRRNLEACRGKYIAYCDGDDYWHRKDKLQLQVDYIEQHPECGLVCSDYDIHDVSSDCVIRNARTSSRQTLPSSPGIEDILLGRSRIHTSTVLARKDLVRKIMQSDPTLHVQETFRMGDTPLWAEISLEAEIFCMDQSLATYNLIGESATQSVDTAKKLRFWKSNSEMALYLCDKHSLPGHIRSQHENVWIKKALQLAYLEGSPELADLVVAKYGRLSVKNMIWFSGAKYRFLRPIVKLAAGQRFA
jgi:glycosyltransferase involved in cell wall biosynthesis